MLILYAVIVSVVIATWNANPHMTDLEREESRENTQNGGETLIERGTNYPSVQAPPWPQAENMLLVPKTLREGDIIQINGTLNPSYRTLTISFLPINPSDNSPNQEDSLCTFVINLTEDGKFMVTGSNANIYVNGNLQFVISFEITNNSEITLINQSNYKEKKELYADPSDIRFISIEGDLHKINELSFHF